MSFDFKFDVTDLKKCLPEITHPDDWLKALVDVLPKHGITTKKRVAMFLAQTGEESCDYTEIEENLNYRASTLLEIFPRYFRRLNVNDYAHHPIKIANLVYSGRMGNGNEASGDGWKFRGRGIIQITGHDNYANCSKALFGDNRLLTTPELLLEKENAVGSACWFWEQRGLNVLSDQGNVREVTHRINGGYNGLADREERYNRAIADLK